jgi:hypothetical protein
MVQQRQPERAGGVADALFLELVDDVVLAGIAGRAPCRT